MNTTVVCYMIYVVVSVALTLWVARTLHRNGRIFLVQAFHGNEAMADSVNHLLVVGFYLINIGYIALALKYGQKLVTPQEAVEFLSTKIGLVLVVLGGMHFFNMFNFDKMRRKGTRTPPPEPTVLAPTR
jgi:cytochrome c biogenesis protein CcdA